MGKKYEVSVPYTCTVTVEVEIDDEEIAELTDSLDDEDLFDDELIEMVKAKAVDNIEVNSFCGNGDINRLIGVYEGSIEPDGINWDKEFYVKEDI